MRRVYATGSATTSSSAWRDFLTGREVVGASERARLTRLREEVSGLMVAWWESWVAPGDEDEGVCAGSATTWAPEARVLARVL